MPAVFIPPSTTINSSPLQRQLTEMEKKLQTSCDEEKQNRQTKELTEKILAIFNAETGNLETSILPNDDSLKRKIEAICTEINEKSPALAETFELPSLRSHLFPDQKENEKKETEDLSDGMQIDGDNTNEDKTLSSSQIITRIRQKAEVQLQEVNDKIGKIAQEIVGLKEQITTITPQILREIAVTRDQNRPKELAIAKQHNPIQKKFDVRMAKELIRKSSRQAARGFTRAADGGLRAVSYVATAALAYTTTYTCVTGISNNRPAVAISTEILPSALGFMGIRTAIKFARIGTQKTLKALQSTDSEEENKGEQQGDLENQLPKRTRTETPVEGKTIATISGNIVGFKTESESHNQDKQQTK